MGNKHQELRYVIYELKVKSTVAQTTPLSGRWTSAETEDKFIYAIKEYIW